MAGKSPITWKATLAGMTATLLVSGGLGLFAGYYGEPYTLELWFPGVAIGFFVTYIMSNLSGTRRVASASAAERSAALAVTAPPGKALVYFYRRGFLGSLAGIDVTVDGTLVAQLKSPRFTCIAVPPGQHRIDAAFSGLAGAQNRPASIEVVAAAGHVHAYCIAAKPGMAKGNTALIPTEMPEAVAAMRGMRMVRPDISVM